jgi:hypothetical protein
MVGSDSFVCCIADWQSAGGITFKRDKSALRFSAPQRLGGESALIGEILFFFFSQCAIRSLFSAAICTLPLLLALSRLHMD